MGVNHVSWDVGARFAQHLEVPRNDLKAILIVRELLETTAC